MTKQKFFFNNSLPHNFLVEKMVLSSLLIHFESIEITIEQLPINAFYFKNHQKIYKVIIFMKKNQQSINILSLTNFLQESGILQQVGGIQILLELINKAPSLNYFEDYLKIIKEKFLRRSLIKLGYKLINSNYITNLPLEKIIDNLENEIFVFKNQIQNKNILSNAEFLNKIFLNLKEKFFNPNLPGLSSGFSNLDAFTQGFHNSDLIFIAGRPSTGKTALSLNIALNIIKNLRVPVAFFSLEMSKEQVMYRIISAETNISTILLKNGQVYSNDWIKITKAIKMISKLPLFIDDSTNLTIQKIRSKIKKISLEQNNIGLIIIDYLQLMNEPTLQQNNRVQELSLITRSLKKIAREYNLPVIALSQLNRNADNRVDKRPILSDLRESGSIEQDADLILLLGENMSNTNNISHNSSSYDTQVSSFIDIIIAKQRNGPTGIIKFNFLKDQMIFKEVKFN